MKNLISLLSIALLSACTNLQNAQIPGMLQDYMGIKYALVKSDAALAKTSATAMVSSLQKATESTMKKNEKKAFAANRSKLLKAAQAIQATSDIEKQRVAFAELSLAFWPVIKVSESVTQQVYYDYCPMKDAYWLSLEEAIENPYYGDEMLHCGSVKAKKK